MSLLTIWGARDNFGTSKFVMQIAMTVLGLLCMLFIVKLDYRELVDKFWLIFIVGSAALLAITLLFGISGINNDTANRSWLTIIKVGDRAFMIQPSEFVKVAFIISFSKHLSLVKDTINHPKTLVPLAVHAGLIVGLILLSGDLGVALVYLGIIAIMLAFAGLSVWYFAGTFAFILIAFPFVWPLLAEYQQKRILVGFQPELDPTEWGWQALLSRDAIVSGGVFGRGLNGGAFYEDLPASHTDFIFSTYCEKFGFVGALLLVIVLVILVVRIIMIAKSCKNDFGSLICIGVAAMFVVQSVENLGAAAHALGDFHPAFHQLDQSVENLGMCLAMLPVIGITLPFMSAGGSSMLALYLAVGMVHSIGSYESHYVFEKRKR